MSAAVIKLGPLGSRVDPDAPSTVVRLGPLASIVSPSIARTSITPNVHAPRIIVQGSGVPGPVGPIGPAGASSSCNLPTIEDVTIGAPLYSTNGSEVGLASQAALPRACFSGIAVESALAGFSVEFQTSGPVSLTAAQWDAITGDTGGLVSAAAYYVDTANGTLTRTPPTSGWFVAVGRALTSTKLNVEFGDGPLRL